MANVVEISPASVNVETGVTHIDVEAGAPLLILHLDDYTADEKRNIELAREYIRISYDPKRSSAMAVSHLCAPNNRFIAPSTFPTVFTLEEYADEHAKLMRQITDLHITKLDVVFAKLDRVCIRYSAEGHHNGEAHEGIPASGKRASWTAAALFRLQNGRIVEFIKEWNKLEMWEQFGWPVQECLHASRLVTIPVIGNEPFVRTTVTTVGVSSQGNITVGSFGITGPSGPTGTSDLGSHANEVKDKFKEGRREQRAVTTE